MSNRQHGGRSPSGGGSPAARRAGRTVPVSRSPAAGRSPINRRNTPGVWDPAVSQTAWTMPQPGTPAYTEPEVRRWPHPLEDGGLPSAPAPEPALHYIRCALSYQNQVLADIKALLEQLAAAAPAAAVPAAEAEEPGGDPSKL